MRRPSRTNKPAGRLSYLESNGEEVLCYVPDPRRPTRVHLFQPGGFLPRLIKKILKNASNTHTI